MDNNIKNPIKVGDSHTLEQTVTEDMVYRFADLSGDYNPVHIDEEFCKEHHIETRVVHGMLVLSFLSALLGMYLPGKGTVWLSQNIDFIFPARIGDIILVKGTVTKINSSNSLGLEVIDMRINIENQHKRKIARGNVKVCIK